MKVTQKRISDEDIQLNALISPAEVNHALNVGASQFAHQMGLEPKGSQTIAQLAKERYGITDLDATVQPLALRYLVPFAVDKTDIMPALMPDVPTDVTLVRGSKAEFSIHVMPKPEFELSSYEPVTVKMPPFRVDEEAFDLQMAQIAQRFYEYAPEDPHPIEAGDSCILSLEAKVQGVVLEGLSTDSRFYTVGAGLMPTAFDKELMGMEPGQTKHFTFEAPGEDADGNPSVEEVECTVTIKEMQKLVVPAIDDEWVKKNMPAFDSAEAFRAEVAKDLEHQQRVEYDNVKTTLAVNELSERLVGEIPQAVIKPMRENLLNNLRLRLGAQGMTVDDLIAQEGGQEAFDAEMDEQALRSLKQGYTLDTLFRHEHLVITDDDIREACAGMNPEDPDSIRRNLEETGRGYVLREAAERTCASKWLSEHVEVVEEPLPEDEEESAR